MRLRKSRSDRRGGANEVVVSLQRSQLADAADEQAVHRQSQRAQKLRAIEILENEARDVNAVVHDCYSIVIRDARVAKFSGDCI